MISLAEAFDTLRGYRGLSPEQPFKPRSERDDWNAKWDEAAGDLLQAFVNRKLVALVFDPHLRREHQITRTEWAGVMNEEEPDAPFVLKRISEHVNPSLRKHQGRTPYVSEREFEKHFKPDDSPVEGRRE